MSAFSTPIELLQFIAKLRELSGGKPTGFKLCIGHPWEFLAICKAMLETGILPDFVVVDGAEGGTGAAFHGLVATFTSPLPAARVGSEECIIFLHTTDTLVEDVDIAGRWVHVRNKPGLCWRV